MWQLFSTAPSGFDLNLLENSEKVCDVGAFQDSIGSAGPKCFSFSSPIYAFSVLTSMCISAFKSAVTFTVTSQHTLGRPWVRTAVFCLKVPLGLADHALPHKKKLKSLHIFHARMHSVLLHNTECGHTAHVWSCLPAACCLQWGPATGIVGGRCGNNSASGRLNCFNLRGHLFKVNPPSPLSGGFTSSFSLRICRAPVSALDPAWGDV